MFRYLSIMQQLIRARAENQRLTDESLKNTANLDYLAMMCGVEMEMEADDNAEQEIPKGQELL